VPKRITAVMAVALVLSAICHIYFLREYSRGTVLWNSNEALLFVYVNNRGHYVTYLRYPWFVIKEYLGGIERPDDDLSTLVIIRVTASRIEHYTRKLPDGSGPEKITSLEGRIYASWPSLSPPSINSRSLCRWAGDHFELATDEESKKLDGINRLTTTDFDHLNGWSRRTFDAGPRSHQLMIEVADKFRLALDNVGVYGTEDGTLSVDLMRPGAAPERIAHFNTGVGSVSRSIYRATFKNAQ
jgi:hypothetical protein